MKIINIISITPPIVAPVTNPIRDSVDPNRLSISLALAQYLVSDFTNRKLIHTLYYVVVYNINCEMSEEITEIEFDIEGQTFKIHKGDIRVKSLDELNDEENEVYTETGSIIYASLMFDAPYMDILEETGDDSLGKLVDVAVSLLESGSANFEKMIFRDDSMQLFRGPEASSAVHLPSIGSDTLDYSDAEEILARLSYELN
jgi:hypothetical protein